MKRTILFSLASLGIASLAHADQHTRMTDLLRIYEAEAPTGDTRGFIAEGRSEDTLYYSGDSAAYDPIYCLDEEHAVTIPGLADGGVVIDVTGSGSAAEVVQSEEAEGAVALVQIDGNDVFVHIAQRAPDTEAIVTATNTLQPTNVDISQDTAAAIVDVCIDGPRTTFDFSSDDLTSIDVLSGPDGQNIFVNQ